MATVNLRVADLEPVMSFIVRVCQADAAIKRMTPQEMCAMPEAAILGISMLQSAVRDLGGLPRRLARDGVASAVSENPTSGALPLARRVPCPLWPANGTR